MAFIMYGNRSVAAGQEAIHQTCANGLEIIKSLDKYHCEVLGRNYSSHYYRSDTAGGRIAYYRPEPIPRTVQDLI